MALHGSLLPRRLWADLNARLQGLLGPSLAHLESPLGESPVGLLKLAHRTKPTRSNPGASARLHFCHVGPPTPVRTQLRQAASAGPQNCPAGPPTRQSCITRVLGSLETRQSALDISREILALRSDRCGGNFHLRRRAWRRAPTSSNRCNRRSINLATRCQLLCFKP